MIELRIDAREAKRIAKQLKQLEPKLRRRVLMRAAKTAMRPVLAAAKANAPKKTGALRGALKLRARKKSRKTVGVRVVINKDWFKGDQYYAAFQEFGWHSGKRTTAIRKKETVDSRKAIEGKHYAERAYEANGSQAMRVFVSQVPAEINRILRER